MPLYPPPSSSGSAPLIDPIFQWGGAIPFSFTPSGSGPLNSVAAALAVYVGKTTAAFTPAHVRFYQGTVASAGTLQAFVASSAAAPDGTNKTLTVLDFVSGPSITASANQWKTCTGWTQSIASGTHLWVGIKTAATLTGSNTFMSVAELFGNQGVLQALYSGVPTLSVGATISANAATSLEIYSALRTV